MNSKLSGSSLFERVHLMIDELSLAIQWNSACILLAVYRSEITRNELEQTIRLFFEQSKQSAQDLMVTKAEYDIPLMLRNYPLRESTIFFVHGLQWGGGRGYSNAYRALNLHREYLVEAKIRCVFWVTPSELTNLTRYAPDFWAFRHKVVNFPDLPSLQSPILEEHQDKDYKSAIDRYQNILRQDFENLPVHQKLANLFYILGCYEDAIYHYKIAIRIAPEKEKYLLALAQIYTDMGQDHLAHRTHRRTKKWLNGKTQDKNQ
jgi:tetratricopeptide (TPR) repeat protein